MENLKYVIFLVVILMLLALVVLTSLFSERKLKAGFITEKMKCKNYLQSIASLWIFVLIIFFLAFIDGISLNDIGLRPISFNYNIWFTVVTLAIAGIFIAILLNQTISLFVSPKAREEANKLDTGKGAAQVLPRTKKEKKIFSLLCITAGICEEIIFRGIIVFLIQTIFPGIPIILTIVITSVIFGFSHFYQGIEGMVKTGIAGAVLVCVVIVSGSLILAMILHFLVDFSSVFILSGDRARAPAEDITVAVSEENTVSSTPPSKM